MLKRKCCSYIFLIVFLITNNLYTQIKVEQGYFRSPIDYKTNLSAGFGELRRNHFHAGIDYKTDGVEGKNIYCVADGYVSRIRIATTGYGKTLYITHPNGLVSVYAHLKKFDEGIEQFVRIAQHQSQAYELDIFPDSTKLKYKIGEVIALSGNTGTSGGPHLHFEFRDEITENAYNPLYYIPEIKDDTPPIIYGLYAYPQDLKSSVNGSNERVSFEIYKQGQKYVLKNSLKAQGRIGFAFEANDYITNNQHKCGIYSIELFVNKELTYAFKADEISFYETRYINAHMDYRLSEGLSKKIHKCFVEPNNLMSNYFTIDRGIVKIQNDSLIEVVCRVCDFHSNCSELIFNVLKDYSVLSNKSIDCNYLFPYQIENRFDTNELSVCFPKNTFYDTICFKYNKVHKSKGMLSDIHTLHHKFTPVHNNYSIAIKIDSSKASNLQRVCMFNLSESGRWSYIGGRYQDGFVVSETNEFGSFFLAYDTIAPSIKVISMPVNSQSTITILGFSVSENLTGIYSVNGFVDDNWVLFEYDLKKGTIQCNLTKESIEKGRTHNLRLIVVDNAGNENKFETQFYY
jgi:hypothetical protein